MTEQTVEPNLSEQLRRAEAANAALRRQLNPRWYPTFHIAAPAGWINDPNGLCFFQGRYQVYFQHNPASARHHLMHWGHVSSEDLVTWRREPIALAPTLEADRDGVFSGSAVVGDDGRLYAFYTGHRWRNGVNEDEGNLQVQCLAVSEDGVSFEKRGVVVEGPEDLLHFRDPKVWRTGGTWWMVFGACSAERRGEVWLYRSENLLDWEFDRVLFRDPDPEAYMLECPDMFPLENKWVILYCPMGPREDGFRARNTHNAGYVVGEWEPGGEFRQLTEYRPLDWGHQFYAPQTFEAPDGRRIAFGWMGSFEIPVPTQAEDAWCGQLTVPRELTLDADLRLRNRPVAEIERLRTGSRESGPFEVGLNDDVVLLEDAEAYEIELEVDLARTTSERVALKLGLTRDGSHTLVAYDDLLGRVVLDRHAAAHGDRGQRGAPFPGGDRLRLRVLVDRGSVEVFVDDGAESVSSFAFPAEGPRAAVLSSESGSIAVESLRVHRLRSAWEETE
ncbi:glycoside hydrolase family 32 protein [Rothia halotolerans]|uniref:glycoside hydrolase family 32 protein n=1 Tax=Rothia halotolerans TaxID=405770 RepID=UPI00101D7974|nr:glycoside hydrolase family 32 protein [Rothia halotolerans]